MFKITGALARYPARALFFSYLVAILIGGLLLYTPLARAAPVTEINPHITLTDSFFTATSAVCVTGLTVRTTGGYFSTFGQVVILALIQFGGIGIMTAATYLAKLFGNGDDLRQRQTLSETLGAGGTERVRSVGRRVLGATLAIEAIGFCLLLPAFWRDRPFGEACWWALFHSISAFCNAGFGLHNESLMPWRTDPLVNFTIMGLVVLGGLGFPVLSDVWRSVSRQFRQRRRPGVRLWGRLTLATKLVLLGTAVLIVVGTAVVAALEWNREETLGPLAWYDKLMASLFAAVTPRTAGFNTVDYGKMAAATLFVTVLLMLIGGGSASTAGGSKVSTFMVLLALIRARLLGRAHVTAFGRTLGQETLNRAVVVLLLFSLLTIAGIFAVLVVGETLWQTLWTRITGAHDQFLQVSFEVVSALCTVGLSVGITPGLADPSKWFLVALMFIGRIGPVSLYVALAREDKGPRVRPVQEEVLIG